jgi:hypothetical protein
MGIFERVLQEQPATPTDVAMTPRQAFAAVVLAAFHSDGQVASEKALRIKEVFSSTRLFREPSAEPTQAVLAHVLQMFEEHGLGPVVTAAAGALPGELRAPAFAIAVDLVMADGQATAAERKFIDGLQALLRIPDETALKIVEVMVMKNSI